MQVVVRLPTNAAIPITNALLDAKPDDPDERTPWMIWWAVEEHALQGMEQLISQYSHEKIWSNPTKRMQTSFLIRRWAAEGHERCYLAATRLLESAPAPQRDFAFASLADGLTERASELGEIKQGGLFDEFSQVKVPDVDSRPRSKRISPELAEAVIAYWRESSEEASRLRVALLCNIDEAYSTLLKRIANDCRDGELSLAHLELLEEFGNRDSTALLLQCFEHVADENILRVIVTAFGRFGGDRVAKRLLASYDELPPVSRLLVIEVLLRRRETAIALLEKVAEGNVEKNGISSSQLRSVAALEDKLLDAKVRELWGRISPGTTEEKLGAMRRFRSDLNAGPGNPDRGKPHFAKHCGICHSLFGEGHKIGPELTTANRKDMTALLANLVDPSAVIRREVHQLYFVDR